MSRVEATNAKVVEQLNEMYGVIELWRYDPGIVVITIEFDGSIFRALSKHACAVLKSFWATAINPLSIISRISDDADLDVKLQRISWKLYKCFLPKLTYPWCDAPPKTFAQHRKHHRTAGRCVPTPSKVPSVVHLLAVRYRWVCQSACRPD